MNIFINWDFPGGTVGKQSICQCRRPGFPLWVSKIPWRRGWQPTPVFLPGESHGQGSLTGYIVHTVTRVKHDTATKPPPSPHIFMKNLEANRKNQ